MEPTQKKIIEAAIHTFIRFGAKKTSMADIAEAANVSRQTLYDLFGNKDELIVSSIRYVTGLNLAAIREGIKKKRGLKAKLQVYFEQVTVTSFRQFLESGDPLDILSGHNDAGRETLAESRSRHRELLEELLTPYKESIGQHGQQVGDVAELLALNAMSLKFGPKDEAALRKVLSTLIASTLALAGQ